MFASWWHKYVYQAGPLMCTYDVQPGGLFKSYVRYSLVLNRAAQLATLSHGVHRYAAQVGSSRAIIPH